MKLQIVAVLLVALIVSALSTPEVASARVLKQGTFQLSGQSSALFENSTVDVEGDEISDTDTFNVELTGVYHVIDHFGLGLFGSYENVDYDAGEVTSYAIGPILQYSFPMSQMANLRFAVTGGYASEEVDNGDDYEADGFFYGGSVALALFPTEYFSVDLGVRYQKTEGETDDSDLDLESEDIAGVIGISVYF
jgi:hypothetical protein